MKPIRIAIVGFGKIAADQHLPTIESNSRFTLAATVSRSGSGPPPHFKSIEQLLASDCDVDAVAVTTPPSARFDIARRALEAGLHVLLEKPPASTLTEIAELACLAEASQRTLFASWHARHAAGVDAAAKALAGQKIRSMDIVWQEDVEKWHPGQKWIWEAGGFGVFDPGINAFSIATLVFPGSLFIKSAQLVYPPDAETPIAAEICFKSPETDGPLCCNLDWRHRGEERWTIDFECEDGLCIALSEGGSKVAVDGKEPTLDDRGEYARLYDRFLELIDRRQSDVDIRPLRLVADTLLVAGHRHENVQESFG